MNKDIINKFIQYHKDLTNNQFLNISKCVEYIDEYKLLINSAGHIVYKEKIKYPKPITIVNYPY